MGGLLSDLRKRAFGDNKSFYEAYNINEQLAHKLRAVGIGKRELFELHQIFSAMDRDNSGEINMIEFFNYIAVWNYCSFSRSSLVRYAFDLYDLDGSGEIEPAEASRCVREVWGSEWERNANAQKVMTKLEAAMSENAHGRLTIHMFQDFSQRHPMLLFPAFQLQTDIQQRVLGERFWRNAAARRAKVNPSDLNWRNMSNMVALSRQSSQKFLETIDDARNARLTDDQQQRVRKGSSLGRLFTRVRGKSKVAVQNHDDFIDAFVSPRINGDSTLVEAFQPSTAIPGKLKKPPTKSSPTKAVGTASAAASSGHPDIDVMADFAQVLAAFSLSSAEDIGAATASAVQPVVVLTHRKDREYKTQKLLNPLAFLFRERTDVALHQVLTTDAEPRLKVFKQGQEVFSASVKDGSVQDRIQLLIQHIGFSPDCPDEASLKHYLTPVDYKEVIADIDAYTSSQRDYVSNTANVSAIIWHAFLAANRPINWAGFYFVRPLETPKDDQTHLLILGPFQGKKACHTIYYDAGVCGAAARTKTVQRIADVHAFEGHIACDSASESEIVVPVVNAAGELLAVIDLDCPEKAGFTKEDERQLMHIAKLVAERSDWHNMTLPYRA
ncbi:hypothetical protein ATCC90586_004610 [Pythium insidiosum]|nr:hypothetical protein ATCC90586_004610 [Pythium insidiosum]